MPAPLPVVEEVSAGGIVVDHASGTANVAVIARRNRGGRLEWCLPKGHLEGDETAEEAAVREIQEETGIEGEIDNRLGTIDYWFAGDDRRIHKVVHHFLLHATGGFLTVEGDPDQEAEDAAWIPLAELPERLSYPNERRLAVAAEEVLRGDHGVRLVHGTVTRDGSRRTPRPYAGRPGAEDSRTTPAGPEAPPPPTPVARPTPRDPGSPRRPATARAVGPGDPRHGAARCAGADDGTPRDRRPHRAARRRRARARHVGERRDRLGVARGDAVRRRPHRHHGGPGGR
ncbi:hypothetical protein GCM10025865_13480 [Paraoerskovia sediminicola]|uniref:Nudix hydrolase domain-containing protein n=1 Tax=Paraoerskovia sediminicola TaxID=1138587 RepID=A0ABM8G1Y6_9CELL|nr:hypothetical protein GCM10025865_13480 [Paraoerskovia sediminicola]